MDVPILDQVPFDYIGRTFSMADHGKLDEEAKLHVNLGKERLMTCRSSRCISPPACAAKLKDEAMEYVNLGIGSLETCKSSRIIPSPAYIPELNYEKTVHVNLGKERVMTCRSSIDISPPACATDPTLSESVSDKLKPLSMQSRCWEYSPTNTGVMETSSIVTSSEDETMSWKTGESGKSQATVSTKVHGSEFVKKQREQVPSPDSGHVFVHPNGQF